MEWRPAQLAVLDDDSRIRVVRAGPGSGKTSVFTEALRRYLADPPGRPGGVAVLSFTNAATDEIVRRMGGPLDGPHYVGTLDAFLYRFVVRPFGHLVGVTPKGARLVPADLTRFHPIPEVWYGPDARDKVSVFDAHVASMADGRPVMTYKAPFRGVVELAPEFVDRAYKTKLKEWRTNGRVSHSDCHFLAAKILTNSVFGEDVQLRLARRFPVIMVDEFQDTSLFLGKAVLRLLKQPGVRSLVVGDPDQAIYEFGGAHPGIFAAALNLDGATPLALPETHRCPVAVARVATAVAASGDVLHSLPGLGEGRAILVRHALRKPVPDPALVDLAASYLEAGDGFALLARRGATLDGLADRRPSRAPESCKAAKKLDDAAVLMLQGRSGAAAALIRSALGEIALGHASPTPDHLREAGISAAAWRRAQFRLLQEVSRHLDGETWGAWLVRVKGRTVGELHELGILERDSNVTAKLKRVGRGWSAVRPLPEAPGAAWPEGTEVLTVHKAKGTEFEVVAYFVPKPSRRSPCPAGEWWDGRMEERRVAFVAASRAKRTFILMVHEETYAALAARRPDFLALFEVAERPRP